MWSKKRWQIGLLILSCFLLSIEYADAQCPDIDCPGLECGDCGYETGPDGCATCQCQWQVGDMCVTDFQYRWMKSNGWQLRSLSSVVAKWTNDVTDDGYYRIPYSYSAEIAKNSDATSAINRALGIYNAMTCLRFEPQTPEDITSVIMFRKGSGCSSSVGRKQSPQRISLGGGCYSVAIVLHEVMHALGVWHEQQRPDRDDYVKINTENIKPGSEFNFKKLPSSEINSLGIPYDIKSIMQYSSYAFSRNDDPTIVLRKNNEPFTTQRTMLSKEDLLQLNLFYNCQGKRGIPETTDCYNPLDIGASYRGTLSTTIGGLTCQRWNSQTPNSHSYDPKDVTGAGLLKNYCRNPDADPVGPWCYTTTGKRWEKCEVPLCNPAVPVVEQPKVVPETTDCYFQQNSGFTYRGKLNSTISGYTCQRWDSQTPHSHSNSPDEVTDGGLSKNFCRNPDSDPVGPWCYTTSDKRWEKCDVPICGVPEETTLAETTTATPTEVSTAINCYDSEILGASYRGNRNMTEGGLTCQRWDLQSPHEHRFTPSDYPDSGLVDNYCRNPDSDSVGLWCYTTSSDQRWQKCDVPSCLTTGTQPTEDPATINCYEPDNLGVSYRGNQAITNGGFTCQRWDSQSPHEHRFIPGEYPGSGLVNNYCRNPDSDPGGIWCYTTSSNQRWQSCNVTTCESAEITTNCYEPENLGASYRGDQNMTEGGLNCQRWDSQSPHEHRFTLSDYPDSGLVNNYCRNPDSDSVGLWCYTTSSEQRWQRCDVPLCLPTETTLQPMQTTEYQDELDCYKPENLGVGYSGEQNTTEGGLTCQRWDSQSPHEHQFTPSDYPYSGLVENYCRNPDSDSVGLWCYTTSSEQRWQKCNVPLCLPTINAPETELAEPGPKTCYHSSNLGTSYRGTKSRTIDGFTCQNWNLQSPHSHSYTPGKYPSSGLLNNYCRNPGSDPGEPWCYTTSSEVRWQSCGIPLCDTLVQHGLWTRFGSWSGCSATCGSGFKTRVRTCINTPDRTGKCVGNLTETRECQIQSCTTGIWNNWFLFSSCDVQCGLGYQYSVRTCKSGTCLGKVLRKRRCFIACDEDGEDLPSDANSNWKPKKKRLEWGPYTPWSDCTVSCGGGFKYRTRKCKRRWEITTKCVKSLLDKQPCNTWQC